MINSMTGFGKAEASFRDKKITVEIRSLNSKQIDINVKMPSIYRKREIEIRKFISEKLGRGKVELNISIQQLDDEKTMSLNEEVIKEYYKRLKKIEADLNIQATIGIDALVKLPNVLNPKVEEFEEDEWIEIHKAIDSATEKLIAFRKSEGKALEKDLLLRVENIKNCYLEIESQIAERPARIKERLMKKLEEILNKESLDQNRLEQELIFYLEKFDINEELVRLKKHCEYFSETLHQEKNQGKKLGFISQEMGREINTIGSKANDADIQQLVVEMKDELERVKEQALNIL